MELVINNAQEEIRTLFEDEISSHPIAWRALHFFWKDMGREQMRELNGKLHACMPTDPGEGFMFKWGKEDVFIICRGVRKEPLDAAAIAIDDYFKDQHSTQDEDPDYKVSVYDLSIAWEEFREFFHFREKEIASQDDISVESIARDEAEIKTVYEEPKPNPVVIKERDERPGTTVLVVEDDDAMMRLLCNILRQYTVVRAKDGHEALDKYYEHAPDVVFLDIRLPGLDGWEVMERIHAHDPKGFVIMVTAHTQADDVQKAIKLGVKGYVKKPFSAHKIQQYVDKFTEQAPKHKKMRAVI